MVRKVRSDTLAQKQGSVRSFLRHCGIKGCLHQLAEWLNNEYQVMRPNVQPQDRGVTEPWETRQVHEVHDPGPPNPGFQSLLPYRCVQSA